MTYQQFFHRLTGHAPYKFQERISNLILEGRSVVLSAPTGTGKTWAVVAPFLYRLQHKAPLGDRLLYALPLRSLATTLHREVTSRMEAAPDLFPGIAKVAKGRDYGHHVFSCLQIGGESNDPFFEGDLVFTTIDQVLSAYLMHPVSLPPKLDNMNAGALIGGYLVFDEVHLLDPDVALGTTVEMLHRLRGLSQFVLMTATLSADAVASICAELDAKHFSITDEDLKSIPVYKSRQRSYRWISHPLSCDAIVRSHNGGRTIVLVNSVSRAQQIFDELRNHWKKDGPQVFLLHSRFLSSDRREKETLLDLCFGPKATEHNAVLVTTQVIEAGIDISADQMHTELAPMNAVIQRAGRVARFEAPRNVGLVSVYELLTDTGGRKRLGPYRDHNDLVEATRAVFEDLPENGQIADYSNELHWIEDVHAETETGVLEKHLGLRNSHPRRRAVNEAMDSDERSCLSQLVRDANSVSVVVSAEPESLNFTGWDPVRKCHIGWPPLLSVPPEVLKWALEPFVNSDSDSWIAKGAAFTEDEHRDLQINWSRIVDGRGFHLLAIHPNYASYDKDFGLFLGRSGQVTPSDPEALPPFQRYQYEVEPWTQHARRVVVQARHMKAANRCATDRLAKLAGVTSELVAEWVDVVCALHDVGKLSSEWQSKARRWQRDKEARLNRALSGDAALAHTDFDPATDGPIYRRPEYLLPPHAVQGAIAVSDGLGEILSKHTPHDWLEHIWRSMVWAVARHHTARAHQASVVAYVSDAEDLVREVLPHCWKELKLCGNANAADLLERFDSEVLAFVQPEQNAAWPFYSHFIRRLRLADQASLANQRRDSEGTQ